MNIKIQKQSGVVLVTALMFLVILTMLALSSMTNTTMEERMAANSVETNRAFQSAESGLSMASLDDDSYDTGNIDNNVHVVNQNIGTTTMSYTSTYREKTNPPRTSDKSGIYEVGDFKAYHFNITAVANSVSGASISLDSGVYQIGAD